MREKTAKVSIICIIAVFLVSCCGIVMAHRAGVNRRGEFMKNRQFQGHSQMFDRGEGNREIGGINKQFNRPDSARIDSGRPGERPGDRPMMNRSPMERGRMGPGQMGPGFMGRGQMGPGKMGPGQMKNNPNLTREEICKNCPICNKAKMGQKGPGFFGEKREGQNRPGFFGEKREGQNRPEFNKPELKIEEKKKLKKSK